MKDIVNEIKNVEKTGGVNGKGAYFRTETMISREYFNKEIISNYPNLQFIRIFMKESTLIYTFHETEREKQYYSYSVFIDKNFLQYISCDGLIGDLNGEKVINLSNFSWKKQLELRNKIFNACSIIMAECNIYHDYMFYFTKNINMEAPDNISIYPYSYKIDGYELLNSTNFILISNSPLISQKELDNLCLEILEKLSLKNQSVIDNEQSIYLNISRKLKSNELLNKDELTVVEQFINGEIDKINKRNTLLIRSRRMEEL